MKLSIAVNVLCTCRQEQLGVSFGERERKKENPPRFRWESNPGPSDYQLDTLAIGPMAEERKKGLNQPTPAVLSLTAK